MNFGDCMSIREHTQHSQCGQCVRYKLLIRRLRNDSAALVHQTKCFEAHLAKQYADRVVYWKARTLSRIPMGPTGRPSICIITDAIDHSKFRVPRSKIFNSKEMGGFIRPCMDMTTVLVHGRYVLMALSEQWVRKDSSWCAELLAYTLGRLDDDLREAEVIIQADNCSRECKNNTLCRFGAMLVGTRRLRRYEQRFLITGHSHEDIDQYFSAVSSLIESNSELHDPQAFVRILETWLRDPSVRPNEGRREVIKVDQVRDWTLGSEVHSEHREHNGLKSRSISKVCT